MKTTRTISALLTVLAAWGCSDDSAPASSGSNARDACPDVAPVSGASCTADAVVCEYGDDPRITCRARATCESGSWHVTEAGCDHMAQAGENGCPVAHPSADAACAQEGLVCQMLGGDLCACAKCMGGPCSADPRWGCAPPPSTSGCPDSAPALGSNCDDEGLSCSYGVPCVTMIATNRRCSGGVWVEDAAVCPQ